MLDHVSQKQEVNFIDRTDFKERVTIRHLIPVLADRRS
jgi:hypothetical protein